MELLANELLIMTFKELLNETSFKYMISTCKVCKKWNELIKYVLIEEIEFRLKSKLVVKSDDRKCTIKNLSYDYSNSTYSIFLNDNGSFFDKKICIKFKYKNEDKHIVYFRLGSVSFYIKEPLERMEIGYNTEWHYEDCTCTFAFVEDSLQYDYFAIVIEKLIISLKRMGTILDLLDGKTNAMEYKHLDRWTRLQIT